MTFSPVGSHLSGQGAATPPPAGAEASPSGLNALSPPAESAGISPGAAPNRLHALSPVGNSAGLTPVRNAASGVAQGAGQPELSLFGRIDLASTPPSAPGPQNPVGTIAAVAQATFSVQAPASGPFPFSQPRLFSWGPTSPPRARVAAVPNPFPLATGLRRDPLALPPPAASAALPLSMPAAGPAATSAAFFIGTPPSSDGSPPIRARVYAFASSNVGSLGGVDRRRGAGQRGTAEASSAVQPSVSLLGKRSAGDRAPPPSRVPSPVDAIENNTANIGGVAPVPASPPRAAAGAVNAHTTPSRQVRQRLDRAALVPPTPGTILAAVLGRRLALGDSGNTGT